jgi:hypothetical protein
MNKGVYGFLFLWMVLGAMNCSSGFANTPDCNVALETCKADCAQRKIYDRESQNSVTRTDFLSQCNNACQEGAGWCLKQDAVTSCQTFAYHCESQCPWSVVDYNHQRLNHTDSFRQCENSCVAGAQACEPYRKSLPSRKRTGDFDQCPEAQTACYADCIVQMQDLKQNFSIIDTDYPDNCAKACAQGVQDCQVLDDAASCDTYETSCQADCPTSVTAYGQPKSDPMVQQWCRNSCVTGRAYCRSLLNLPVDRTTAPALKAAAPAPAPAQETKAPASKPSIFNIFNKPASNPSADKSSAVHHNNTDICNDAESHCKQDCRKNQVLIVMQGGFWPQRYSTQETDFFNQCEAACSAAKPTCMAVKGESDPVCKAFKNTCRTNCPQVFHDQNGNQLGNSDGENRCWWACTIGTDWCNGRGEWNACEHAAEACSQYCRFRADQRGSEEFFQTCDRACDDGEESCEGYNDCDSFQGGCEADCGDDTPCQQACTEGTTNCQSRAGLSYE